MSSMAESGDVRVVRTAAALLIGSELLSGKTRDENLSHLATTLRDLGIDLCRASFVKDDRAAISVEVRSLRETHDVVFTSGGVGPTHDDVTLDAVADALGVALVKSPELEAMLTAAYGEGLRPGYDRMTLVPEGAELLRADAVAWPTIVARNVWLLPGIPEIFRKKLAVVRAHLTGPVVFHSRAVRTTLFEAQLKSHLDATVARFPNVQVGSYPHLSDAGNETEITFDGTDVAEVEAALADFRSRI